jgi:glutathione S-transferase
MNNTPEIILHHYSMSPFAEKVRAVLGYKQLAWKSVIVPSVMPKPDVQALTGGYRKTPFMQIGRDVFCDTALICDVLEHLQPTPALFPVHSKGMARVLAQWADTTLFWAAMAYNFQSRGVANLFANTPPEAAKAFGEDRAAMRGGMGRILPGDAAAAYKSYLRRLADMLDGQRFLLGTEPCVADFAAYHPLWFTRTQVPLLAGILDATPAVLAWMDRMAVFGHGQMYKSHAADAIAVCAASAGGFALPDSTFQDEHGIPLGSQVTIAAESFGLETTQGELVGAGRTRYTLRRLDPRAGEVLVHFPRIGYVLKPVKA